MIFDVALSIVEKTKAEDSFKDFEFEVIKYFMMESPITEDEFKNKSVKEIDRQTLQNLLRNSIILN